MAATLKILTNFGPKLRVILDQKNSHAHPDASPEDTVNPGYTRTFSECLTDDEVNDGPRA